MCLKKIVFFFLSFLFMVQILMVGAAETALQPPKKSDPPEVWQQWRRQINHLRKSLLGNHDWRKEGIHNGNQVSTVFYNYGTIGQPSNTASLVWPKGGYDYGFEFGVLIAAEVFDTLGIRRHIISEGLDTGGDRAPNGLPWGFEPLAGYARYEQEFIAMSDDKSSWPASWPNRPAEWAGKWIAEYGLDAATADQESYYVMDDAANAEFGFFPDQNDRNRRGLGVEVESRGYQWHQTLAQDCIFFIYNVKNVGSDTLKKVYLGMYGDPHVGGASDYDDDDGAWDTYYDMVYSWDHDFRGKPNSWLPGYLAYKYLESPGEPYDNKDNDDDGIVDESMQDDIDNDGDWNPLIDDVGADGISGDLNRNGIQDGIEEWDRGEGDGVPTHGEPNFDETDLDESDQIGLTSFAVYEYNTQFPSKDEATWSLMVAGTFDTTFGQTKDNAFQYASGPIKMAPGDKRRFSITVFFGYDKDDLFRSAKTVQRIYNEGYRFTRAPERPKVTAVAGDHRVTLYWDDFAEYSRDPIMGYDFAGYNIYRGTNPGLTDAFVITDAQGNPTLYKPIAQFNVAGDGWFGPHPIETENGIHFYMGANDKTGLKHSWTDTTVVNGQTYYYAVVSFDHGDRIEIPPTECNWEFEEYPAHSGKYFPTVNTAIVTPQAPAAGYVPPTVTDESIQHVGPGTGLVRVEFLDPDKVKEGRTYQIDFDESNPKEKQFNFWDNDEVIAELLPVTSRYQYTKWDNSVSPSVPIDSIRSVTLNLSHNYIINNSKFQLFNADSSYLYPKDTTKYVLNSPKGWVVIKDTTFIPTNKKYYVKYQRYLVAGSPHLNGSDNNPYIDGMRILVKDDSLMVNQTESRFVKGNANWDAYINRYPNQGVEVPKDYLIVFTDTVAAYSINSKKPAKFYIVNLTDTVNADFIFLDTKGDSIISDGDAIIPITYISNRPRGTWQAKFFVPRDSIVFRDSLTSEGYPVKNKEGETYKIPIDTIFVDKIAPKAGDQFLISTHKPFSTRDKFSFKTKRAYIVPEQAKSQLEDIAVVPNPYIAASEWEIKPNLQSGRGDRLIQFIHLPSRCTIRIYTLAGELVQILEHDSPLEDGSEPWNLLSKNQMDIAYGIYIFHVEAPGIGEQIGKFAVIK
ncbi:hypothetical protein JW964_09140 [candidate division KSB1 bacterium]|nr:hypothetical protein [candidate division KSB1 bacterium]